MVESEKLCHLDLPNHSFNFLVFLRCRPVLVSLLNGLELIFDVDHGLASSINRKVVSLLDFLQLRFLAVVVAVIGNVKLVTLV